MKWTMRPGVRLGLVLGRRRFRRLLTLRRRNAGIIRRLGRQAQLRLKLGDPSRQRRDLRHQCGDQRVLLRVREARKVGARGHDPNDSDSSQPRQSLDPSQFAAPITRKWGEQLHGWNEKGLLNSIKAANASGLFPPTVRFAQAQSFRNLVTTPSPSI